MSQLSLVAGGALARRAERAPAPQRVCGWELVALEAVGGLARVYRARPAGAPSTVAAAYAFKSLKPEWEDEPRALDFLRRETAVSRAVAHPRLVSILAASLHEPPYFTVMPWLEGATLAARLADTGPLDPPTALWIARQAAEGLDALERAGWMHGDLKPSNLMLSPDGHATLLDLGFARHHDDDASAAARCVLGTVSYMAPEVALSAVRPDIRSDIYSLGVMLYEMLSGRLPLAGWTLGEIVAAHRTARPRALRSLAPHLSAELGRLVHAMLAKNPLRRPQTSGELVDRLAALEIASFSERTL